MKNTKILLNGFLFILSLIICTCDDFSEIFETSEYRILSGKTLEILNIDNPRYVFSENKDVAVIQIENGDIVITSTGKGRTNVYIGDIVGLSNQARIMFYVEGTGKIVIEEITVFNGKAVNPNIKYAVTVNGIVGNEITQTRVDLQMNGTHFIVTLDMDVTSWFTNLPAGLSAQIFEIFAFDPSNGPNEVYINISGTPLSASSEEIKITVPGANSGRTWEVYFNTRADARFNITK